MRSVTQPRLRSSAAPKSSEASRSCERCEAGSGFHLHCQICRAPLEGFTRKTCPGDCKKIFKTRRRETRFVRCWVIPLDAPEKKFRKWLPKRFATPPATRVATASGARRAIFRKETGRKSRRSLNG
jgi:predicted nucleic acid-binding Zn ribbon protein